MWKWDNTNAYGYNPANESVSGTAFEYNPRFAGQYFDKETGLHYNKNRIYNPELARYMQPDPIGVNGGMNIYSYVENNPLNYNDPEGLLPSLSQGFVDITAALGDNLFAAATFGLGDGQALRESLNISGVDTSSSTYRISNGVFLVASIVAPIPNNKAKVAYSVIYEVRLTRAQWLPPLDRYDHFKTCNQILRQEMTKDPQLALMIKNILGSEVKSSGKMVPGFSWHHHDTEVGLMQLVYRAQHDKTLNGGIYQHLFHPQGGKGGMSLWQ